MPVRLGWLDGKLFTRFVLASQNRSGVHESSFLGAPYGVRSILTTLGSLRFLSAQYSFPKEAGQSPWMQGWLTPRVQWAYRSSVHLLGPEVSPARQNGYDLIGARLSDDLPEVGAAGFSRPVFEVGPRPADRAGEVLRAGTRGSG